MAAPFRSSSRSESTNKQNISKRRQYADPWPRRSPSNDARQSRNLRSRQMQWQSTPMPSPSSSWSIPPPSAMSSEHTHHGITMERTPSGNSIMSDTPIWYEQPSEHTFSDEEAARLVEKRLRRPPSNKQHERILRNLIERDGEVDDCALGSILTAVDALFFDGKLSGRVRWEWSNHNRYQTETIGHTALRCCADGSGIETLIVLSQPILGSGLYDRRLLLSAFLHELVHCYLFIMCGFDARIQGGHTDGFERIVAVIDTWVGRGYLRLCSFKADLDLFRHPVSMFQEHEYHVCNPNLGRF